MRLLQHPFVPHVMGKCSMQLPYTCANAVVAFLWPYLTAGFWCCASEIAVVSL